VWLQRLCCSFLCRVTRSAEQPPLVTTTDLVEQSASWDGKIVSFKGEVLEDVLARSDGTWMNLSDGNNSAMGVFVPKAVAMPAISWTEDYRTIGDTVLVTGVFTERASSTRVRLTFMRSLSS